MMPRVSARPPLRISLVICTLNRAGILARCLRAACSQDLPEGEYEVLLVDNGSTDETRAIAQREQGVRYLRHLQPGLSNARNAGAFAARAPLVAFIDDDAIAAPDLLRLLAEAFDAHPQAGCVGGRIRVVMPPDLPRWCTRDMAGYFSEFHLPGSPPRRVTEVHEYPFGANVAYRAAALERAGGFQTRLGRVGNDSGGGEELDLECRLAGLGYELYYEPRAVVDHVILPERVRWSHVAQSARAAGRNWAYYERELTGTGSSMWSDLRMLAGAWSRVAHRENTWLAYSQSIFWRSKILRRLRYALLGA